MSRTSTPSNTNHVYHLSEALYDALTLHASKSFLGLRTGAIAHDDVTHVDKSEFQFKSFEQVRDDALAAATCLALDVQLSRRQFFGICCSNCYDWLLFEFACCFNDLPLVGINTSWQPDIVSYVINLSHIVCVACSAEFVPVFQALKQSCPSLSALVVIDADPLNPIPACSPQDPLHVYVWNASLRTVSLHHSPSSHAPPCLDLHSQDSRTCGTTHTLTRVGMRDYLHLKLRGELPALEQDDVHSLVFTSGTSGVPKGVVITKTRWYLDNKAGGIMANHADPAFLSYNSWSHGADRGNIWMCVFLGARVGIGRELGGGCSHTDLLHDVAGIEPTCFFAFSYLWSELHALFLTQLDAITICQAADMLERQTPAVFVHETADSNHDVISDFQVALRQQNVAPHLALQVISPTATLDLSAAAPEAANAIQLLQQSKHTFVNHASQIIGSRELLLSNWFQRMGGRVLAAVTGGGHTSDEVLAWMQALFGFKTTEYKEQGCIWKNSYGSSEFPGISLNGAVSDAIDLELVPIYDENSKCVCDPADPSNRTGRGEIRVRHKDSSLSVRYYRNEEATAAACRDGWYYTGDIGEWALDDHNQIALRKDDNGKWNKVLVIVDRVKNLCELYVDGDSKWVDPGRLEADLYSNAPCVKQICLLCDRNQPSMVAVVVPSDYELQRWRVGGDAALADESIECNSSFAAYLLEQLTLSAQTRASSTCRTLHAFEIPCAVVVCAKPWTMDNGLATANGKLKRGDLKRVFQKKMEAAYYCAFNSSTSFPSENSRHSNAVVSQLNCASAAVVVPSPIAGHDVVTKVADGFFYMNDEITFRVDETVQFIGGVLPEGIFCDRIYVVTSKSNGYPYRFQVREHVTSGSQLEVQVADTRVAFNVHRSVCLPGPLSLCMQQLGQLTGAQFVRSKMVADSVDRGRVKNDVSALPFLEGSNRLRDFIAFEFKGADEATTSQANAVMCRLKALVETYRNSADKWVAEAIKIKHEAELAEAAEVKIINDEIDATFLKFMWGNEDATAGTGYADDNHSAIANLEALLVGLISRIAKIKVLRSETKRLKHAQVPAKALFLKQYNIEADTLRVWAPRFGLSIPYEIEHVVWWQSKVRETGSSDVELMQGIQNSEASTQNFGDIVVTCCVTGMVIQENEKGAGKPRYNNIEDDSLHCSVEGYTLVQSVLSHVQNMRIGHHEVADEMWAMLNRCPLFAPFLPSSSISRSWCMENNSSFHLLQSCFISGPSFSLATEFSDKIESVKAKIQIERAIPQELQRLFYSGRHLPNGSSLAECNIPLDGTLVLRVRNASDNGDAQSFVFLNRPHDINHGFPPQDTPAGRLYRAFRAFATRPALGIPDAVAMRSHPLLNSIHFRRSAFADALGIELSFNRGYRWISFGDLGRMASLVSKVLRAMAIPRGSFVAISGYNDIEWAACDFACALSGLVSVGIHSTFNAEESLSALQNSGCVALLTSSDFVLDNETRGVDKPFWSVQSVFALAKKKQQSACISQLFLTDASCASGGSHFTEIDAPVQVHSLVDLITQPSVYQNVSIEHPDLQPDGGLDSIFTILHTGGSGGRPKQVIVKARGFARDIGAKNYMMPLITCSYIPLSHSSDRFKLWEVCCCGGSVAFAFYEASHWLSHERLKKSQALETGSLESVDFSSVDSLLRQLQDVQITAMSCPPNILAGVYRMYNHWTSRGGMSHQEACHQVRRLFGGRLKTIATGGAPTPSEIMSAVREWFPKASFVDSFGTTECGAISANGKLLTEKGVRVKVRRLDNEPCCGVVSGELLVFSPSMSAGYLNDETRTAESFIHLPCDSVSIFPAVGDEDTAVTWYATGDLVEISYDEHAFRNHVQGQAWAKHISVRGRICSQVKLSSGSMVSPDVLESIYNSSLFSDIYLDARTTSSAIVAIVTPAASLKDLKQPDGTPLFDFDEICPRDFFSSVEGHRNEVGSQFYTRRRQFIDAAISECRSIATRRGLAAFEIPVSFHVEIEPWTVHNRMMNSNLKKNRKMFETRYSSILQFLHAPFINDMAVRAPVDVEDKSLKSLALTGDSWAVLCTGGSSANHVGTIGKPWQNLHADHSHLSAVNQAFQTLSNLIGRDRIIVIGSYKTHLNFLQNASKTGFPPFQDKYDTEASKVMWSEKLADFQNEFFDILEHCDYDGDHVNPSTIIDVISGRQVHFPTPVAGRVIPYSAGVRSVFFYIHTHGWSYAIPQMRPAKCDLCVAMGNTDTMLPHQHPKNVGHDHSSLRTREWYLGMPHSGDPRDFGSVVFPAEGKPCLDPFDTRLKSFVSQMACGTFKVSDDGVYPTLYTSFTWKDEKGHVLKRQPTSWDVPTDETYFKNKSKVFNLNRSSRPVYIHMQTREATRSRPDAAEDALALLPESWVEFLHYQNCYQTSTWVINPLTSNCALNVFLHDGPTADSEAPFLLDFSLWQHFFQAIGCAIGQSPFTKFVVCFDACGSGGLAKFLNDQAYEKHAQVGSWPLAIIASSNEQIYTKPIGSRLFSHLDAAFNQPQAQCDIGDEIGSPTSASRLDCRTPLRRFFSEVMDTVRAKDSTWGKPAGFGDQGIVLASGSSSGIEAAELQSIFYNRPRS